MIRVELPIKTVSETNQREPWPMRHRRRKGQRQAAGLVVIGAMNSDDAFPDLPVVVTLVRLAPRALDDDNLRGALKAVRDGVADALMVDDRDARVTWTYDQRRGAPKYYGVEIRIERTEESAA